MSEPEYMSAILKVIDFRSILSSFEEKNIICTLFNKKFHSKERIKLINT